MSRLTAANVPCGLINTVPEGFALAESSGLDPVVRLTDERGIPRSSVRSPITLSATPATYRLPPPPLSDPRPRSPVDMSIEAATKFYPIERMR